MSTYLFSISNCKKKIRLNLNYVYTQKTKLKIFLFMAKYIVETYYTCNFKVKHYLDDISNNQLDHLDKRDDGEFEILDVKFDKRNKKSRKE